MSNSFIFTIDSVIWSSQGSNYLYPISNVFNSFQNLASSFDVSENIVTVSLNWDSDTNNNVNDTIAFFNELKYFQHSSLVLTSPISELLQYKYPISQLKQVSWTTQNINNHLLVFEKICPLNLDLH